MGKLSNKYVRELIKYYMSVGMEKFYLDDDNSPGTERLSDVLKDYIHKGIVNVEVVRDKN